MWTFILEDLEGTVVDTVSQAGNEAYLARSGPGYRYLADVYDVSSSTLAASEMDEFIAELALVAADVATNPEARAHVEAVVNLALRCRDHGGCLTIAPVLRPPNMSSHKVTRRKRT